MEDGLGFVWPHFGDPYFLTLEGFLPYLSSTNADSEHAESPLGAACPLQAGGSSSSTSAGHSASLLAGGRRAEGEDLAELPQVTPLEDEIVDTGVEHRFDRKEEALSVQHRMTHLPKNLWCSECQRANMQQPPARRGAKSDEVVPDHFGQVITVDHVVAHGEKPMGRAGDWNALVILGHQSGWTECFPLVIKGADEAYLAIK